MPAPRLRGCPSTSEVPHETEGRHGPFVTPTLRTGSENVSFDPRTYVDDGGDRPGKHVTKFQNSKRPQSRDLYESIVFHRRECRRDRLPYVGVTRPERPLFVRGTRVSGRITNAVEGIRFPPPQVLPTFILLYTGLDGSGGNDREGIP